MPTAFAPPVSGTAVDMAEGDRSTLRIDGAEVPVIEIDRPRWGTTVYRAANDANERYLEQLISVGPYKVEVPHVRRLTEAERDLLAISQLDLDAIADAASRDMNTRSAPATDPAPSAAVTPTAAMNSTAATHGNAALDLVGRTVHCWVGVEMFIRSTEPTPDMPEQPTTFEFTDPQVPCLQLLGLAIELDGGGVTRLSTYERDAEWGLAVEHDAERFVEATWGDDTDGYRRRTLDELPTGTVSAAVTYPSGVGDFSELELTVGGRLVLLVAGETHEEPGGRIAFHRHDESVLVFTSRADYESVAWIPADGP